MNARHFTYWVTTLLVIPFSLGAQSHDASVGNHKIHLYAAADFGINAEAVTFTKDIAPIFQRSCQDCHRIGGGAPMPLTTYEEVRRLAPRIKYRTAIRDRMGAMPPFFVEKDIGIHEFKNDPSLSDEELAKIQAWADNGAPEGDPADMPEQREFPESETWTIGEPDLVLSSREVTIPAIGPDWWGDIGLVPTGLTEDRYVKAVQVREVNDIPAEATSSTVGGRYM